MDGGIIIQDGEFEDPILNKAEHLSLSDAYFSIDYGQCMWNERGDYMGELTPYKREGGNAEYLNRGKDT